MKKFEIKREIDYSWDFKTANTKEFTHCYHNYPAMMIPQVARRLIKEYKPSNCNLLFDPYCGSGTSLVEANILGIKNIGTDLNPLARLIAKSKNTIFDIKLIKRYILDFENETFRNYFGNFKYEKKAKFNNIEYWFSEEVINKLSYIKDFINNINNSIKDYFLVAFSETIRESSYTRNNEYKLFRIPENKMTNYRPDVFGIFLSKLRRNIRGLEEFKRIVKEPNTEIYDFNTCDKDFINNYELSYDMVVTSPPYGDSRTTVAYGQFSRLSNQWLDVNNANKIDQLLMGGNDNNNTNQIELLSGKEELGRIKNIDIKRYNEVMKFIYDYKLSIDNISKKLNKGGVVCYVVGNRTVKGNQIPLDLITAELFTQNGFEHIKTIIRNIPSKRMPRKNSPSNKIGYSSNTMNNEYIVILKK